MYKKLYILLLTLLAVGCKPTTDETIMSTENEPEEPVRLYTPVDINGTAHKRITSFYAYELPDSLINSDTSIANVDIVRLEPYIDEHDKIYHDLSKVPTRSEFEAFLYQDTLYLKFFRRGIGHEGGIRVKVVDNKFNTAFYSYWHDNHHSIPPDTPTPLLYCEVEHYVNPLFEVNKQALLLNKKNYILGDTIWGGIYYEGIRAYETRIPMNASLYLKGIFKGVVKEGKQFTLTSTKNN